MCTRMCFRARTESRRGFSIVELLVIISGLMILTSIMAPSLMRAKDVAQKTKCATNLRNMGSATLMYIEDNYQMFPDMVYSKQPGNSGGIVVLFQPKKAVTAGLNAYESQALVCPSDSEGYEIQYIDENGEYQYTPMSYGYNVDLFVREIPYEVIKTPSDLAIFYDGCPYGRGVRPTKNGKFQGQFVKGKPWDIAMDCVIPRHMERCNVLYGDWHVEQQATLTEDMIYDDPNDVERIYTNPNLPPDFFPDDGNSGLGNDSGGGSSGGTTGGFVDADNDKKCDVCGKNDKQCECP